MSKKGGLKEDRAGKESTVATCLEKDSPASETTGLVGKSRISRRRPEDSQVHGGLWSSLNTGRRAISRDAPGVTVKQDDLETEGQRRASLSLSLSLVPVTSICRNGKGMEHHPGGNDSEEGDW